MKISQRTNLWFNQYDWCLKLHLPEAFVLRRLNHDWIDHVIQRRRDWARAISRNQPGSWMGSWVKIEITENQIKNLHDFCDFLLSDDRPRKLTITGDWMHVYTTDPTLIDDIKTLSFIDHARMSVRCVKQMGLPNTIQLKKAKHRYRSYFRNMSLDSTQRENLHRWLSAQSDIRMSPSLSTALENQKIKRIFSYYFIDHDEKNFLIMLDLISPNLIRRTLPIIADK